MSGHEDGVGGNREVPSVVVLDGAEANLEEDEGSWGKHGFPHASERRRGR